MIFSQYILDNLFENEEVDMRLELTKIANNLKNPKLKDWFLKNIENFGIKNTDLKSLKTIQYNKPFENEILNILNTLKIPFKQSTDKIQIDNLTFRQTGKQISSYWKVSGASGAQKTNYQEIGVLLWLHCFKNNIRDKNDIMNSISHIGDTWKNNIFTDSDNLIQETIDFLTQDKKWNQDCKNAAQAIESKFTLSNYTFHQGGKFFNDLRNLGKSLANLGSMAADKWNPSDIYLIKKGIRLPNFKTITDLNNYLAEFNDIIGVSLKGSAALHGALSFQNALSLIGKNIKLSGYSAKQPKGEKLTPQNLEKYLKVMKEVQSITKKFSKIDVVVTKDELSKTDLNTDLRSMAETFIPNSADWGASILPGLNALAQLNTEKQWEDFAFITYATASSRAPFACPHYKAYGTGKIELVSPGLDKSKFEIKQFRIPMSGAIHILLDISYEGHSKTIQFRSKGGGSLPQGMILNSVPTDKGRMYLKNLTIK